MRPFKFSFIALIKKRTKVCPAEISEIVFIYVSTNAEEEDDWAGGKARIVYRKFAYGKLVTWQSFLFAL